MIEDTKQQIFEKLKESLSKYSYTLKVTIDSNQAYELWSIKDFELKGKKYDKMFFASAIIQKGFVSFYYMPIYTHVKAKDYFKPELLKLLKGKSCFHIKKYDEEIFTQIEDVLEKGFELYKQSELI